MNQELLSFIEYHNLDIEDFYDASGRSAVSCYAEMKSQNKLFAFNTTACNASGHTVRDRQGHCIVCNTAHIAFSLRTKLIAHIYIACSVNREITKVGMSTEIIETRLSKLNSRKVGNTNDWQMISSVKCSQANNIELQVHSLLVKYQVKGDLYGSTEAKELFRCSYQKAKDILDSVLQSNNVKLLESNNYIHNKEKFQFRNLISL